MKDIVITEKMIRRELYVLLGGFVAAMLVNVGAIIAYDRPWSELYSQIGFVFFITGAREGTRASRRVEEGLSRSLSGGGGKPSCPSPSAGDLTLRSSLSHWPPTSNLAPSILLVASTITAGMISYNTSLIPLATG